MNASVSAPAAAPLLFNWEPPRRRKMAITVFVVASFFAHALCFYDFQIVCTPSSQPPCAVPITHAQVPPATSARATTFSFSTELNSLGAPHLPGPSFAASNNEPPDHIRFRVAVSARGDIRYCFPLNTSGDPA